MPSSNKRLSLASAIGICSHFPVFFLPVSQLEVTSYDSWAWVFLGLKGVYMWPVTHSRPHQRHFINRGNHEHLHSPKRRGIAFSGPCERILCTNRANKTNKH